ncbi:MAG: hypothetical protein AAF799_48200 [Myxococcota bacterium]
MPDRPSIRWGLAIGHAFLALLLVAVVTGTLAAILGVADPRKFGEGVGRLSVFFMLGGFGASCLAQTGRRTIALVIRIGMLLLLGGLVALLASVDASRGRDQPSALPSADLVREQGTIRHPVLGFSLPDPGPSFQEQPALATQLTNRAEGTRAWVYVDLEAGTMVTLVLASDVGRDRENFDGFFRGFVAGQVGSMEKELGPVEEKALALRWDERRASAHNVANGFHIRVEGFGLPSGEGLIVMTLAGDEAQFTDLGDRVVRP